MDNGWGPWWRGKIAGIIIKDSFEIMGRDNIPPV